MTALEAIGYLRAIEEMVRSDKRAIMRRQWPQAQKISALAQQDHYLAAVAVAIDALRASS